MRRRTTTLSLSPFFYMALAALAPAPAGAQGFDSGSDGSYGPIEVPEQTTVKLPLPADGVFHATTITVREFGRLEFERNELNTPVYLLATGDVLLEGGAVIAVNAELGTATLGGRGGPGGFDGGTPGTGQDPGAGHGPGGGLATDDATGGGSYGTRARGGTEADGPTYGSPLLVPLLGGSGGGGSPAGAGGGGGGAVLIASPTVVRFEGGTRIDARGGAGAGDADGSGGAIRIVAPAIAGVATLRVDGGSNGGGDGRIRIDVLDRSAMNLVVVGPVSIGAFMTVFPPNLASLSLIEAAGEAIAEGATDPSEILLPFGSSPDRKVKVRARGFTGVVPIEVALIPESGEPRKYPAEIDMAAGDPQDVEVDVEFPINTRTHVYAWTRTP